MTKLILRKLKMSDEDAFYEGLKEYKSMELSWYTFVWMPGMEFDEHLQILRDQGEGNNLPDGFVPGSFYYAFIDGKIIGRVSIRHKLNEKLKKRGGHLGYSIAPAFRKMGYGKEMARQAIEIARQLGVKDILITCGLGNIASLKIIENLGGVLENEIFDDIDNEIVRRYWIKG